MGVALGLPNRQTRPAAATFSHGAIMPKPLNLFVDTNVFLSFFAFSKDDIEELRKVTALVKTKQIKIYVTDQLVREFQRNREKKIHDSLEQLRRIELSKSMPRLVSHLPESNDYLKGIEQLIVLKDNILSSAIEMARTKMFPADELFRELVASTEIIAATDEDIKEAMRRRDLGDPPGKKDSLGDQINWEILLRAVEEGQALYVVSQDGDFASALNKEEANEYLKQEWKNKGGEDLILYNSIRLFVKKHFPHIKVSSDVERRWAIDNLVSSNSFFSTHHAIGHLSPFIGQFSLPEVEEMVHALENNTQIRWICQDADVQAFYRVISEPVTDRLTAEAQKIIGSRIKPDLTWDDEIPF